MKFRLWIFKTSILINQKACKTSSFVIFSSIRIDISYIDLSTIQWLVWAKDRDYFLFDSKLDPLDF